MKPNPYHRTLPTNTTGRDFVVGDVHGCFDELRKVLELAKFDVEGGDRLISVGDLVDRGPKSEESLKALKAPWFFAVRGNHEQLAIDWFEGKGKKESLYRLNGGGWFIDMPREQQREFHEAFSALPIAIDVEIPDLGKIGIVHALVAAPTWELLVLNLHDETRRMSCMWARSSEEHVVPDVTGVVVGHVPGKTIRRSGNVLNIDTGAGKGGCVTMIHLAAQMTAWCIHP